MNKKLMAVAVASAFGALGASSVALAQSSTVTISGNLNYIYGQYNNGGNGTTTMASSATSSNGTPRPSRPTRARRSDITALTLHLRSSKAADVVPRALRQYRAPASSVRPSHLSRRSGAPCRRAACAP